MGERQIIHVDVNNAFLSWTAVEKLKNGEILDIRAIPSIIGGDEKQRRGVVLAKSTPAKHLGIKTGEPIYQARKKCPDLKIYSGNYECYRKYSDALYNLISEYTNKIERFSIDECFVDLTDLNQDNLGIMNIAKQINKRVKQEFGFTVNIGISNNKLLAKMASDFEKPDKIHTLYKNEIQEKMWNLNVSELFMVGRQTVPKLQRIGIDTIGDLAKTEERYLIRRFGKYGRMMWEYANGIDNQDVEFTPTKPKGIGNSITLPYDVNKLEELEKILFKLVEQVSYRLRKQKMLARVVCIKIKDKNFQVYTHQSRLKSDTNCTKEIYLLSKKILKEMYKNEQVRLIGVRVDNLSEVENSQMSIFNFETENRQKKIDSVIDEIKDKYGYNSITRASTIKKDIK